MTGKTIEEATEQLKKQGIKKIIIENNFEHPLEGSTKLVVSCKINNETATLVVGSFKLDL